ncbi:hypothetical protein CDV36_015903, partial [Fusarium kuroshium]
MKSRSTGHGPPPHQRAPARAIVPEIQRPGCGHISLSPVIQAPDSEEAGGDGHETREASYHSGNPLSPVRNSERTTVNSSLEALFVQGRSCASTSVVR